MKNEVGVPLFNLQDLRGMDRIFSLSKFVVETFRLTSVFLWQLPFCVSHGGLGIFSRERLLVKINTKGSGNDRNEKRNMGKS